MARAAPGFKCTKVLIAASCHRIVAMEKMPSGRHFPDFDGALAKLEVGQGLIAFAIRK